MTAIEAALIDFQRSPGRYPVKLRQPELLYRSVRMVLQIASGRSPDDAGEPPGEQTRKAACFFIRQALLFSDADHYELMGLERSADAQAVKERYRLLMRLLHPDFASPGASEWPADAAVRVNRAYETLGDAARRAAYDAEARRPVQAPPHVVEARPRGVASAAAAARVPRSRLGRLATVFGGIAGVVLLLTVLFGGSEEGDGLVQQPAEAALAQSEPGTVGSAARGRLPNAAERGVSRAGATANGADAAHKRSSFLPVVIARLFSPSPSPGPAAAGSAAVAGTPAVAAPEAPSLSALMAIATPSITTSSVLPLGSVAPQLAPPDAVSVAPVAAPAPTPLTQAPRDPRQERPAAAPIAAPPAAAPVAVAAAATLPDRAPTRAAAPVIPAPAPVAVAAPAAERAPARPAAPPMPAPAVATPGLTLAQAQPLLAALLHQMESGGGDRLLMLLDRDARNSPAARAFSQHYNAVVADARPVKLAHVQFRAEPHDGRLVVTGVVRLQVGEPSPAALPKELQVVAEFANRDGKVILTGLGRGGAD